MTAVYQNGILVPSQNHLEKDYSMFDPYEPLPSPLWRVGLTLGSCGRPDISRCTLVDAGESWHKKFQARLVQRLWETEAGRIQMLAPRERFVALGRFAATYQLSSEELGPLVSDILPIPFLERDGSVKFYDKLGDCEAEIAFAPAEIDG